MPTPSRDQSRGGGGSLGGCGVRSDPVRGASSVAASGSYCGASAGYIPGYTNCPQVPHYFINVNGDSYNQALTYHPNDGDYVCETIEDGAHNWISRKCGQNQALSGTVRKDQGVTQYFYVGNDSPKPHYVDGYWAANF